MSEATQFSRRERQIMDALYRLENASVKEIRENIVDAPSYSAVRTLIQKLVDKGHVAHREEGKKYVYYPLVNRKKASKSALTRVVSTFFRDSTFMAMNSLLDMSSNDLTDEELGQLERLIQEKKEK
jgi:predicted transcriptional regulator